MQKIMMFGLIIMLLAGCPSQPAGTPTAPDASKSTPSAAPSAALPTTGIVPVAPVASVTPPFTGVAPSESPLPEP